MPLFADEILEREYRERGWTIVRLLDAAAMERLSTIATQMPDELRQPRFTATIMSRDVPYRHAVDAAVRHEMTASLERLLPAFRIAFCNFAIKGPGAGEMALHQDWSFVDEEQHESIGLWLPLTDVEEDSGCLCVIDGSHRAPTPPRGFATHSRPAEGLPRPVPMRAGDAMLFSHRLFHSSAPNTRQAIRTAATAVLLPHGARARYVHGGAGSIDIYDVDDAWYLEFTMGEPPVPPRGGG